MLQRPIIKSALPGPKAAQIIADDTEYVTSSFSRYPYQLVVEKGSGVWIEDTDGNVFMDCNAGIAVCSTGHCHPEIVESITKQTQKLIHMCGTNYYYRQMPELAKKLDKLVPIKSPTRTYFANSGAEAVEAALKLAMYHTKRQRFI
jgi:4-aminobutyrate aminotransferase